MEFRLLGPVSVVSDGQLVPIGGPMPRAVLAFLLLRAGRLVTLDQLVDALWGEEPPPSAPSTLRAYLSRLKRALGGGADTGARLRSEGGGYVLHVEPGELDIRTFEIAALAGRRLVAREEWAAGSSELAGALALWRGRALSGMEGFPALAAEGERLEDARLLALGDRIEADLALGRHAEVTAELEALVATEPYRERAWGQLMLALYRSGRQADALAVYHRARRQLDEELGIEPGPELRSLEMAVLRQDPSLDLVAAPSAADSHLPPERSSFVGRSRELAHLERLLLESRMVTMTGVGGSGKTRLALRAARQAAERYPDGVWWAELASVTEPQLIPQHVAAAVGVSAAESKTRDVTDVLIDHLADREALLVLDNCEHLVDAVAAFADRVLARCPAMRVLATSREALGVAGEVSVPVAPLDVPPEDAADPEAAASVRLFLDRARSTAPGFSVDDGEMRQIAAICRRLEGIPLAVELAASRVKVLAPAEIAERLRDHLDLVSGGPRTALPRHRSLRATMDWSYNLLDHDEQRLFRSVSVFVGGFGLDAAAAVLGDPREDDPRDPLQPLAALVDRSLLEATRRGRSVRYRLLEPVRQYAAELLESAGDADAVRERHARHYLRLAEEGDTHLRGGEQGRWLDRLDAEHPNLRAALGWALDSGRADLALRLTGALGWYWLVRGHWAEARRWLDRALAAPGGSDLDRARAVYRTGGIDIIRVNLETMPALVEEALATCRREGDAWGAAWCLHLLGHARLYRQPEGARELLEAGMEAFRAFGDEWGYAWSLRYVAAARDAEHEVSLRLQRDATQRFRELGDLWSAAFALYGLGLALTAYDRLDEAGMTLEEGRELCRALDDQVMAAHIQRAQGLISLLQGELADAASRLTQARETLHRAGDENCYAVCSQYLGIIRLQEGDPAAARHEFEVALAAHRSIGRDDGISQVLGWLGAAAWAQGEPERAAVLIGASRWADAMAFTSAHPLLRRHMRDAQRAVRRRLGPEAYRRRARQGERMPREEAIRFALGGR
ncbi:MAG TPA: BTAD domain-containing putative transcriptional regulator [Candidatus Limnocylindrales bacterium]|nr:BTAD domain-containing putative transcriptional regulator [Candidatus Limnocylindrales bacterium]